MARTATADAREHILEVASALFYERGVRAVGMAEIVAVAGCGKNLLYRHFPGKADLVATHLERFGALRRRSIADTVAASPDPGAALVAVVQEAADRVAEPAYRGCALRNYLTEFPSGDAAPDRVATQYLADSRALVDGLVAALGIERPAELAERVTLVLEGLYASRTHPRRRECGDAAVELVRQLVATA